MMLSHSFRSLECQQFQRKYQILRMKGFYFDDVKIANLEKYLFSHLYRLDILLFIRSKLLIFGFVFNIFISDTIDSIDKIFDTLEIQSC